MFEAAYEKGCCILPQNEESPYETASNRHTVKVPYCEITTVRFFGVFRRENKPPVLLQWTRKNGQKIKAPDEEKRGITQAGVAFGAAE